MPHLAVVSRPLDAASAGAAPALDGNLLCQICLDAPAAVSQLCGAACLAELCASCVARHLAASVYAFYPGVLPKVRCPVCLTLLNKSQWQKFVQKEPQQQEQEQVDDNSHVLDKYAVLCRQSCGFQSPCCHNADYTMLPHCDSTGDGEDKLVELTSLQVEALPELLVRAVEFCYHRQDTSELYEFMTDKFQDKVEEVLSKLLPKIDDEERRAALLLWHLSKNPNTQTRCCKAAVCFKCKATNHHDGNCRDFVEEENVVECRGCGVTVVMVEGCDSLRCLCGHSFSWSEEVARQRAQHKRVASTDNAEYDRWATWHNGLRSSLQKVENMPATQRELRLARLLREHRPLLRRVLLQRVYRRRLTKKNPENLAEAVVKLKNLSIPQAPESQLLSRSQSVP